MSEMDVARVPSPEEIEQQKTYNGGWTRHSLNSWGVAWPPKEGWKEELEKAYKSGFTVGVVLECIGCRRAKFFVDYDQYPLCYDCQRYEKEKYEREHYKPPKRGSYKKQPIPPDIRWAVWERDNFTCQHCGTHRNLTIDHIIPESKGGPLTIDNTQTLCKSCNSKKGAR